MKITKLTFLMIFISFLVVCGAAQQIPQKTVSAPLKLLLSLEKTELCVGKAFKISARMENVSDQVQIIDKRSLWRYINVKAQGQEIPYDEKKSIGENLSESTKAFRFMVAMGDGFSDDDVPREYLITLKPKEFYEDSKTIKSTDKFFNKPGKYTYQSGYGQYADWSSKSISLFIGNVDSDELEFILKDCKEIN